MHFKHQKGQNYISPTPKSHICGLNLLKISSKHQLYWISIEYSQQKHMWLEQIVNAHDREGTLARTIWTR